MEIGNWLLLLKLAEVVVAPGSCFISAGTTEDDHSAAATQAFLELVEKLSIDDSGEMLLQPLGYVAQGYSLSLIQLLLVATTGTDEAEASLSTPRGGCSVRLLSFLLRRSTDPELICFMAPSNGLPVTPSFAPNRLFPLRSLMLSMFGAQFSTIVQSLDSLRCDSLAAASEGVRHPGHAVARPFSVFRSDMVELLVLLIEADVSLSELITPELWVELISWITVYAHNNVYHNSFYRLFFAVLRY